MHGQFQQENTLGPSELNAHYVQKPRHWGHICKKIKRINQEDFSYLHIHITSKKVHFIFPYYIWSKGGGFVSFFPFTLEGLLERLLWFCFLYVNCLHFGPLMLVLMYVYMKGKKTNKRSRNHSIEKKVFQSDGIQILPAWNENM